MGKKCTIVVFLVFCLVGTSISQTSWPKTLLWRISGNDLKKSSYLFGTMHLQDKRLFNLGDSFYYHFERTEGFAIEVDFTEYMDSVLTKTFMQLEERDVGVEEEMSKDTAVSVVDTLLSLPPPPPKEINKRVIKALRKERSERIRRLMVHGQMPTILDAYLYGIAIKKGKWLGAVETVSDQLNLRDELGKDIDEEDWNPLQDRFIFSLEKMVKIYLDQDLNAIENYLLERSSKKSKTIIFNNRNVKMAHSIDSLSRQRSMFYAVGAGHLPGDSGIITLLRERGYSVTPVFSNNKLAAEKYAQNLPSLAWTDGYYADSLYRVEMPGSPKIYSLFGDLVKMNVFVDITDMTMYMTGHTIAQFEDAKLEEALREMAKSMNPFAKVESVKKLDRNNLKGVEGITSARGYYYRIQLLKNTQTTFYLMFGSGLKSSLSGSAANRFLNSFNSVTMARKDVENWREIKLPEKAFSVSMPGEPKINNVFAKKAAGSGWKFTVYDYTDLSGGFYYLLQIRETEPGRYLDGDSAFFSAFKDGFSEDVKEIWKDEMSTYQGFPAFRFDGLGKENEVFYKTKSITRGNRIYILMVIAHASKKNDPAPERFFDSFKFTDYKPATWSVLQAPDRTFSTWVPATLELNKENEETDSTQTHYVSFNENETISYEIFKTPFPEYYWANSDSVFFENRLSSYKTVGDSVLSSSKTLNGRLSGREEIIQSPQNNNLLKVRMILSGDTLYTLMAFIPAQYIDNENHQRFFKEFRVKNEQPSTTIFSNKAAKLFEALQSKDSAAFSDAKTVFEQVSFTRTDLPILQDALLVPYLDDTSMYYSFRSRLVTVLSELSDSGTVDFIRQRYQALDNKKEEYRFYLLDVLANQKTDYSYNLLKELLIGHLPAIENPRSSISYRITDSLLLTRKLFPEILSLTRNGYIWMDVAGYAAKLLDSNMISIEMLRPYENDFIYHIDTLLKNQTVADEDFYGWQYLDAIFLLGKLNSPVSNAMLQKVAGSGSLQMKQEAVVRLLENSQSVSSNELTSLAANLEYRLSLYEQLKKINKLSFFPTKYLTQRYFAEAELYNFDDEYYPAAIEFIGQKDELFNGSKQRFYLFKLSYDDGESEPTKYLGIAGPYSADGKDVNTTNDATDYFLDEEYDKKKVEAHFRQLLKKGEEYLRNRLVENK